MAKKGVLWYDHLLKVGKNYMVSFCFNLRIDWKGLMEMGSLEIRLVAIKSALDETIYNYYGII